MTLTPTIGNAVTFSTDPHATLSQVLALSDDSFIFTWDDGADIHARHLDEQGSFTGGDVLQAVSDNDHPLGGPLMYQQADGSLMLTYNLQFSASEGDVYSHRLDRFFNDTDAVTPVENTGKDEFLLDSAAMLGGGGVIAYVTPGAGSSTTSGSHLELQFLDAAGASAGNRVFIHTEDGDAQQGAKLVTLPNGNLILTYENFNALTGAREIRLHHITPQGFDSQAVPISDPGVVPGFPNASVLADGSCLIVWQQNGGLAMRHILESGFIAGGVMPMADTMGALVPKVTALKDGTFMVAWSARSGLESDGSADLDVFVQHMGFDPAGKLENLGDQLHIVQPGDQGVFELSMTTLADGRVVLAYGSETGDSTNLTRLDYRIVDPRDATLTGDGKDNTIVGRESSSSIVGLGGNDMLIALGGNDLLSGGGGNDTLTGGLGNDTFAGGSGVDLVSFRDAGGAMRVNLSAGTANGQGRDALTGIENVTGSSFADTLAGSAADNRIDGGFGADVMRGLGGNDTYLVDNARDRVIEAANGGNDVVIATVNYVLAGGQRIETLTADEFSRSAVRLTGNAFAQSLNGNDRDNVLDGKAGADTMAGGFGNDTFIVDNAGDRVIERAGEGTDRVVTSVRYTLAAGQSVEQLATVNAVTTTAINLAGNELAQAITGNDGSNVIAGGGGNDLLAGRGGADAFLFDTALNPAANVDRIADFDVAADTLRLENAVFTTLRATGGLKAGAFFAGAAAHDAGDRIVYDADTGALSYDSNGDGAGGSVQFAELQAGLKLTAADFFVI